MPAPSVNFFNSYFEFCISFSNRALARVLFREFVEIADKCQCVDGWSKSSYFGRRCCSIHISHYHVYKKGPKVCRETSHFFQPCWNCGKITTVISFKALTTTSYYLTWKTLSNRNRSLFEDALLIFCWAIIGVKFLTWFTTLIVVTICYYYK